jgi:hypothetical protein
MLDLNKFLPLNSIDQVDALISHLKEFLPHQLENMEGEILMDIRKVKIQFYFKEQFNLVLDQSKPVLQTKRFPKEFVKEFNTLENLKELKGSFAGFRLDEVAKELDKPVGQLIRFLGDRKITAKPDTILSEKAANILKAYARNILKLNTRKEKIAEREEKLQRVGNAILEEKFKPSHGKEGNYAKLIYTRPKS